MSLKPHLKIGTKVRIKVFNNSPDFWDDNGDMAEYMGKVLTIYKVSGKFQTTYKMKECTMWNWLEEHFDVIKEPGAESDPNFAFWLKKRRDEE